MQVWIQAMNGQGNMDQTIEYSNHMVNLAEDRDICVQLQAHGNGLSQ